MDEHARRRVLVAGVALAGVALLQGCAVVTAPYVAERAPVASHSMVTRFDKRFLRADGSTPTGGSSLYMPRPRERGLFYFRY
ncbi:MAG TPA: hypothetical protein VFN38_15865 [Gemmatimonadaceae bacterium]|nr:hypothetical protein [Gemmatimonadaceae bacterium]